MVLLTFRLLILGQVQRSHFQLLDYLRDRLMYFKVPLN